MTPQLACDCCGFAESFESEDIEEHARAGWAVFAEESVEYVGCPLCPALFRDHHEGVHEQWRRDGRPEAFTVDDCVPVEDRDTVRSLLLEDWKRWLSLKA